MLSNKDFKALLSTPSGNSGSSKSSESSKEKTRFDLKQVKQWDKEIEKKLKSNSKKSNEEEEGSDGIAYLAKKQKNQNNTGYRDRALERRQKEGKETLDDLEVIASKLDHEQTKFLGGDVDHTHLVKGLDYALLRQIKGSLDVKSNHSSNEKDLSSSSSSSSQNAQIHDISHILTSTTLGLKIKEFLVSQNKIISDQGASIPKIQSSLSSLPYSSISTSTVPVSRKQFQQSAYEFDVDPLSFNELPVFVSGSKQDFMDETRMDYVLSSSLSEKLKLTFAKIRNSKLKKKKSNSTEVSNHSNRMIGPQDTKLIPVVSQRLVKMDMDDIYGGIIEDKIGKYIPVGSIDSTETKSMTSSNVVQISGQNAQGLSISENKNVMSKVDDLMNDILSDEEIDNNSNNINNDRKTVLVPVASTSTSISTKPFIQKLSNDMLKPVNDMLKIVSEKQVIIEGRLQAAAEGSSYSSNSEFNPPLSTSSLKSKQVIHRSIFDAPELSEETINQKKGQSLAHGTYDMFSDVNNFYTYDSDDDDEGEGNAPRKRPKKK